MTRTGSLGSAGIGMTNFSVCVCVSVGYTRAMAMKDSGLRIRVERPLREAFLEACRIQDKPAAQVIREFMRSYLTQHTSVGNVPAQQEKTPLAPGRK